MSSAQVKKIVYLFGAGATHAELANIEPAVNEKKEERGLLIGNVSSRVIEKARRDKRYLKNVEMVSGVEGSLNIELLISLIENSKIDDWAYKTTHLKSLVEKDIKSILKPALVRRFYLHKALLELHEHTITTTKEQISGLISLNYDDVLDQAHRGVLRKEPAYCFTLEVDALSVKYIPLLKLHGSFNWESQRVRNRARRIEIIPLGSSKSYLHAPYGFIWNRALEILIECDILRVIGCSLSPNDTHLIDLLFKAHLERAQAFDIEIIDQDLVGDQIRQRYGFFPKIKTLIEIGVPEREPENPFRTWLKYKSIAMLGEQRIKRTRYLKKVVS